MPAGASDRSRQQGAFVYTGSGKKQRDDTPLEQRMCTEPAISIQRCRARNNHKELYCKEAIAAWRMCVEQARALEAQQVSKQ